MLIVPGGLCHAGGDDGHLVDLVGVAAAGEVVDGSVQTLKDGSVGFVAAETLCDLVADVAGLDEREDEGVGLAGDLGVGALGLRDVRGDSGVELELTVDDEVGVDVAGLDDRVVGQLDGGRNRRWRS